MDVDDLADFLLVRDRDVDGGVLCDLDDGLHQGIEAFFFDAQLILAWSEPGEGASTVEVGLTAEGRQGRQLQENAGGGDGDPVFVGDGDGGSLGGLSRGSAEEGERKEEAHAGQGYFTVGCGVA